MKDKLKIILLSLCILNTLYFCNGCNKKPSQPEIAVANSYLYSAVKDICTDNKEILNLVPPGMCPGHFDISPSQVNALCNCKILFVFDFQQNIENAIPRIKERGLKVCKILPAAGMCIPDTYLSVVSQITDAILLHEPARKAYYESKLKEIKNRLENLSRQISEQMKNSGLLNTKVIASQHQAEFTKWLGLNTVSTFAGRDTITPAQINQNLRQADQNQVKLIIANKQEGTELAQALAEHLKVKLVVFSNFPVSSRQDESSAGFDELIQQNVNSLLEVMK